MVEPRMAVDETAGCAWKSATTGATRSIRRLAGLSSKSFVGAAAGWAEGRPALVVSCGPSMPRWRAALEELSGSAPLVVCVKQAIEDVGQHCDIHVFNAFNVQRYRYGKAQPLVIAGTATGAPPLREPSDYRYKVQRTPAPAGGLFDGALAFTAAFADHELVNTGLDARPWGPGIMYEIVFPLLVHMRVGRIFTTGWDIASPDGANLHYYDADRSGAQESVEDSDVRPAAHRLLQRFVASRPVLKAVNGFRRRAGFRYNPAPMLPGEAALVSRSVPQLRSWLSEHDIELQILSDSEWFSDSPPAV